MPKRSGHAAPVTSTIGTGAARWSAAPRLRRSTLISLAGLTLTAGLLVAGAAVPTSAGALSPVTLAKQAASTGPVVVDSAGNGYVTWATASTNANGDPIVFCKMPAGGSCTKKLVLPIPKAATWNDYEIDQAFPVVGGKAGVISVVGTSYDHSNVVVWTSQNSGKSFGEPVVVDPNYGGQDDFVYDGTGPVDVLRSPDSDAPHYPDYFSIASVNPGLFYTFTGIGANAAPDPPAGFQFNTSKVAGGVASASLGYGKSYYPGTPSQATQTVEAFSTDANDPQLAYFWSPVPGESSPGSLEHGPIKIGVGMNPRLAGGPKGLFLLSEDYVGNPESSNTRVHLDVRAWNPATRTFGAPRLVTTLPNDINASNEGGFTEDAKTGRLTVAWPMETKSGGYVMDVWGAAPGHAFKGPTTVGNASGGYTGPARIATVNGRGFLTWSDYRGLQLAHLPA